MATTKQAEPAEEWIDVATVAAEMHLSEREVWERMKRWGVRVTHPHSMSRAKFRRSEFEERREAGLEPPPPPKPRAARAKPEGEPAAPVARKPASDFEDKMKRLKAGRA